MTNHIHIIASAKEGSSLSDVLRDWLLDRFAFAGSLDGKIQNIKFWQEGNEAKEIHTNSFLEQKLAYIHQNPLRAEIVTEPEHYLYSSARDYAWEKGLLDVTLLE